MSSVEHLAKQLTEFYYEHEFWHTERLGREEANRYHEALLRSGNIITVSDGERLVGYCEFSKASGVCFINNLFILPEYRQGRTARMIYKHLMKVCSDCKIFSGSRLKNDKRFPEFQLRSKHERS